MDRGGTRDDGTEGAGGGAVPSPGTIIAGRYRVLGVLGAGAMGTVLRVEHRLMGKQLALKLLHADMTRDEEMVARFQREAQAAGQIDHPNVCAATDFGRTDEGAFFLVMELLSGETLEAVLVREGRLTAARAVHVLEQMAAGLAAAHAHGIVHRDLKPENVMLSASGGDPDAVKILDFGVAKVGLEPAGRKLTRAGTVYGTPEYMAPEQAAGGRVDGRADLYALGVIAFELLTGRLPFLAEDPYDLLSLHLTAPPPTLREAAPDTAIPRALEPVVARLLEKRREDRYPDATAVREALLDALARPDRPSVAAAPSPVLAGGRVPPSGRRALWATLALAAVGALTLAVGTVASDSPATRALAPPEASGPRLAAPVPDAAAPSASLEATPPGHAAARAAFAERPEVRGALASLAAGQPGAAVQTLGALRDALPDDPHACYYLGLAHAAAGAVSDELRAYADTLRLEPAYAHDEVLVTAVLHHLGGSRAEAVAAARQLVVRHLADASRESLAELARLDPRAVVRQRARDLLVETGRLDALAPWSRLTVQLRAETDCEARRALLRDLALLREPRALPVLRVVEGSRSGCGPVGRDDCNACMRSELAAAIADLEAASRP